MSMKFAWGYVRTQVGTTVHKFWVARNICAWIVSDVKRLWSEDEPMPIAQAFREVKVSLALWLRLLRRALLHDLSKYRWDEAKAFAQTIDRLRTTTYGSPGYDDLLKAIKPAISLHYSRNRHHPEFHPKGFAEMTRVDRIEMIADWGAAVRRHDDGDLDRSLTTNAGRFLYSASDEAVLRGMATRMRLL